VNEFPVNNLLKRSLPGNPWLQAMLDQVFGNMILLRIQTIQQNQHGLDIQGEPLVIYEAIVQRNSQAATTAMLNHLQSACARVIQELQLPQSEAEVSR
jgi:DNA-binding GntR family transcriptional regulator